MSSSIFDDATDISVGSEVGEVIGSVETDEENLSRGNLLEFLSRIGEIVPDIGDENEEDKSNKDMDADSYHNKAVERARHKRNREAAEICMEDGTETIILNGSKPALLYDVLEGKPIGTRFIGRNKK